MNRRSFYFWSSLGLYLLISLKLTICKNKTQKYNFLNDSSNGPAELALWTIIVLITLPIILAMIVILICCNYVCFWFRPYPNRGPALIVDRGCSRNSNNFNAF